MRPVNLPDGSQRNCQIWQILSWPAMNEVRLSSMYLHRCGSLIDPTIAMPKSWLTKKSLVVKASGVEHSLLLSRDLQRTDLGSSRVPDDVHQ